MIELCFFLGFIAMLGLLIGMFGFMPIFAICFTVILFTIILKEIE